MRAPSLVGMLKVETRSRGWEQPTSTLRLEAPNIEKEGLCG